MTYTGKVGLLLLLLGAASGAGARECSGLLDLHRQSAMAVKIQSAYGGSGQTLPGCSSSRSVLAKLMGDVKRGGTNLEPEKPFDPVTAQANLQEAMNDPEIKKRVAELQGEIKDEDTRLFFEAALFDEEGFYGARDLRIQQLQQRLH